MLCQKGLLLELYRLDCPIPYLFWITNYFKDRTISWAAQAQFFRGSNKLENETISFLLLPLPSQNSQFGRKSFFSKLISHRYSIGGLRISSFDSILRV